MIIIDWFLLLKVVLMWELLPLSWHMSTALIGLMFVKRITSQYILRLKCSGEFLIIVTLIYPFYPQDKITSSMNKWRECAARYISISDQLILSF